MGRLSICSTVLCVVLFCLAVEVKSDFRDHKKLEQHYNNVLDLRRDVENFPTTAEVLLKKSESLMQLLEDLKPKNAPNSATDGICERMSQFFDATNRKHRTFEDRVVTKLDEMQDEQLSIVQKILSKKNCPNASTVPEDIPETLAEVSEKIEKFETKLKSFGLQQNQLDSQSAEQMQLLREISGKLAKHQGKFENIEKQVTEVIEHQKNATAKASNKHALPMNIVMGMIQNNIKKTK